MRWAPNESYELTLADGSDADRASAIAALQVLKDADTEAQSATERLLQGLNAGVMQTAALETLAGWCHAPEGPGSLRQPAISASNALFGFRLPTPDLADPSGFFWRVARKLESASPPA
ncbi:MAG: hypothetical protein AB8H79_03775 [Myxococcota bacterium]